MSRLDFKVSFVLVLNKMKSLDLVFIIGLYAHGSGETNGLPFSRSSQMRKLDVNANSYFHISTVHFFLFRSCGLRGTSQKSFWPL